MKSIVPYLLITILFACGRGPDGEIINVNSVKTDAGLVSGTITDDHVVKVFMGIPFAAPPLGNLRWKAPCPVEPWKGVRECVSLPASAMQGKPVPFFCWSREFLIPEEPISEDCLYLNVWTPAEKTDEKLPVMVWIHGGGFSSGSGTVPLYNGEAMARKGVVFVTINYRLGIFGFFAHPELTEESELGVSGNYGILDQIAALGWIRDNIEAFGGDPGNVTIAGQSAGAFSVNMLVVSPLAKGLFHKAIAQSGGAFGKRLSFGQALSYAEEAGLKLTKQLGLESVNDLRNLSADSILSLPGRYSLTLDSVVILPVYSTIAGAGHNDVPLISGWNADDGVFFGPAPTSGSFSKMAKMKYGDKAEKYLQLFPANTNEEAAKSQKLASQLSFGWNNYTWASLQSKFGENPSFLYCFSRIPPGEPNYGAFHSAEFGYALHTLNYWGRPFTIIDYRLEETMCSYWVNFAKTGNPNGDGLPLWPVFKTFNPEVIEFGDEVQSIPLPYREQMEFLSEIN